MEELNKCPNGCCDEKECWFDANNQELFQLITKNELFKDLTDFYESAISYYRGRAERAESDLEAVRQGFRDYKIRHPEMSASCAEWQQQASMWHELWRRQGKRDTANAIKALEQVRLHHPDSKEAEEVILGMAKAIYYTEYGHADPEISPYRWEAESNEMQSEYLRLARRAYGVIPADAYIQNEIKDEQT